MKSKLNATSSFSSSILKKAYDNPDEYRDLVVRIGGFSIRFCDISRKVPIGVLSNGLKKKDVE